MYFIRTLLLLCLVSTISLAEETEVIGTYDKIILVPSANQPSKKIKKHLMLNKWHLSAELAEQIKSEAQHFNIDRSFKEETAKYNELLPQAHELGMNGVPVLDQGPYGSCVIFSTTSAIDAAIGRGDYISQLCSLQLGRYLEANAYAVSGWQGSQIEHYLHQLSLFGFITKQKESYEGCGGLNHYPKTLADDLGTPMSIEQFKLQSDDLDDYGLYTNIILDTNHAVRRKFNPLDVLYLTKRAITQGDRLILGSFIPAPQLGVVGAVGQYKNKNDTWVLSQKILNKLATQSRNLGGHAMVITGYDDNAIVYDDEGRAHQGILKLRSSWGEQVGDKGDFYMTYEYFRVFVSSVVQVSQ